MWSAKIDGSGNRVPEPVEVDGVLNRNRIPDSEQPGEESLLQLSSPRAQPGRNLPVCVLDCESRCLS